MTINRQDQIKIPTWLLIFLLPLLIALGTSYSYNKSTLDKQEEKTAANKEAINELQSLKVDRAEFKIVLEQLKRIEDKVDRNGRIVQDQGK